MWERRTRRYFTVLSISCRCGGCKKRMSSSEKQYSYLLGVHFESGITNLYSTLKFSPNFKLMNFFLMQMDACFSIEVGKCIFCKLLEKFKIFIQFRVVCFHFWKPHECVYQMDATDSLTQLASVLFRLHTPRNKNI